MRPASGQTPSSAIGDPSNPHASNRDIRGVSEPRSRIEVCRRPIEEIRGMLAICARPTLVTPSPATSRFWSCGVFRFGPAQHHRRCWEKKVAAWLASIKLRSGPRSTALDCWCRGPRLRRLIHSRSFNPLSADRSPTWHPPSSSRRRLFKFGKVRKPRIRDVVPLSSNSSSRVRRREPCEVPIGGSRLGARCSEVVACRIGTEGSHSNLSSPLH